MPSDRKYGFTSVMTHTHIDSGTDHFQLPVLTTMFSNVSKVVQISYSVSTYQSVNIFADWKYGFTSVTTHIYT